MKITIESWLKFSAKFGIWLSIVTIFLYVLFLCSPIVLTPIANNNKAKFEKILTDSTGLEFKSDKVSVLTFPNLSVGLKFNNITISDLQNESAQIVTKDFTITLKTLPLIFKKIQLGQIRTSKFDCKLKISNNGNLSVIENFANSQNTDNKLSLPLDFRLSNNLPSIYAKDYNIQFINTSKNRTSSIQGKNFYLRNFVLNKRFKLDTDGDFILNNKKILIYNINLFNKIMPDVQLHDLFFQKDVVTKKEEVQNQEIPKLSFDINKLFDSIEKNNVQAQISTKLIAYGDLKNPKFNGLFNVEKFSLNIDNKKLPDSNVYLKFTNNNTEINSNLYTSQNSDEKTVISGIIKNNFLNLNVKSKANLNNISKIVNNIFKSIGNDDFETLSASGDINADFSIKTDFKKLFTNGFLNLNNGNITYSLYNIVINNINSNIDFSNNNINIKNLSLEILNHPLKIFGVIKQNSEVDLNIITEKMPIKGLVFALGKLSVIKDNNFDSGLLTVNAVIKGRLKDLQPKIRTIVENVSVFNKPLKTRILLSKLFMNLSLQNNGFSGDMDLNSLVLKQNANSISVPKTSLAFNNKGALIKSAYLFINNSRIDVTGQIKNYLKDNLNININAKGNIATTDIAMFIPAGNRKFFPYKGVLPINAKISGDKKTQNISFNLSANPTNYISLVDIKALKNKSSDLKADIKISDGNAKIINAGFYSSGNNLIKLSGNIVNIFSSPKLDVVISIPNNISFPIWGLRNSNVTGKGKTSIVGNLLNPTFKGEFDIADISAKDLDFVLTNTVANIYGNFINGNLKVKNFKFGGLKAENLSSDFALKNLNNFYLPNIKGKSFDGKINGKMSYDIKRALLGLELTGNSLNATEAVYSVVALKNALTGSMDFYTKFTTKGFIYKDIVYALAGNANFTITNGRFMGIGKVENIVNAQNIAGNYLLKSAISGLTTFSTIQKTDKFDKITGNLTFSKGDAKIHNIKVYGPLMTYYVTGAYHIITNSATLKILGRLDSSVVSCLGVLGNFSAEKLLGAIPKFGEKTLQYLNMLTVKPETENIALIPKLTSGSTSYKDFKATFYGSVQKASSLRTFKWLSKCDTSQIDLKKEIKTAGENVKQDMVKSVENTKNNIFVIKNNITNILQNQKQKFLLQIQKEETKTPAKTEVTTSKQTQTTQTETKQQETTSKTTTSSQTSTSTTSNTEKPAQTQTTTKPATTSTTSQAPTTSTSTSTSTSAPVSAQSTTTTTTETKPAETKTPEHASSEKTSTDGN